MYSSYFDCPEEDVFACDFEAYPIDIEVKEGAPEEKPDFQDIQFEQNSGNVNFEADEENFNQEVSNYESESDEDSPQQHQQTLSRTCDSRTVQKTIKKRKEDPIKKWTEEENKSLQNLFQLYKGDWDVIVKLMEGRTVSQCKQHWGRIHNQEKKKRLWTPQEDDIIRSFSISDQFNNWALIASSMRIYMERIVGSHWKVSKGTLSQLAET